jgi:hypothetical protein
MHALGTADQIVKRGFGNDRHRPFHGSLIIRHGDVRLIAPLHHERSLTDQKRHWKYLFIKQPRLQQRSCALEKRCRALEKRGCRIS